MVPAVEVEKSMNIKWNHIFDGVSALTGNPATAVAFKIMALAAQSFGLNSYIDVAQQLANEAIDAAQNGFVPNIRPDEPRHEAAIALATQGTPVPADIAAQAPGPVPPEVVAANEA